MSALLQKAVDSVNSVAGTSLNIFTSFITFNYYVGDLMFSCLAYVFSVVSSILVSLLLALQIMLEDLVVFLQEISEGLVILLTAMETCLSSGVDFLVSVVSGVSAGVMGVIQSVASSVGVFCSAVLGCLQSIGFFCDLLGRSILLLCGLLPRTLYIAYVSSGLLLRRLASGAVDTWTAGVKVLASASPELLLGMAVGLSSSLLLLRLTARVVRDRERRLTLDSVLRSLLWAVCRAYVAAIRLVARVIGLVFTVVEMTISHLRVPMFAHAGDSDDEDEDRENLVGEVEEESAEEREKQERKRSNYQLMVERAAKRAGGNSSVEGELLAEMEREREDKLCVVCQDKEKCIMILPCRHLCICETCMEPLRTIRNTCPICRRGVKQIIKAYL